MDSQSASCAVVDNVSDEEYLTFSIMYSQVSVQRLRKMSWLVVVVVVIDRMTRLE